MENTIEINGQTYYRREAADRSRPRVLRHHMSGVWICYVLGEGSRPDTLEIEGRRVWGWYGGRLETSQLATQGVREGDKLGDWVRCEIGQIAEHLIDAIVCKSSIVEGCKELPTWAE